MWSTSRPSDATVRSIGRATRTANVVLSTNVALSDRIGCTGVPNEIARCNTKAIDALARRLDAKRKRRAAALRRRRVLSYATRRSLRRTCVGYLVDPASSDMLVLKIKPCMYQYKPN